MIVTKVSLKNFRNYEESSAELWPSRNILIGENAQGKTNFLEAIEILANGSSDRASRDAELIRNGASKAQIGLTYVSHGEIGQLALELTRRSTHPEDDSVGRAVKVNGVTYSSMKHLPGHLSTVSFKSEDLNLLRGGPKYRRQWIDRLLVNLKPSLHDEFHRYQKIISQRNRLLKTIFEKGSASTALRDELKVWDEQAAQYGASITARRLHLLAELSPKAAEFQRLMSADQEDLSLTYELKQNDSEDGENTGIEASLRDISSHPGSVVPEAEIGNALLKAFRANRYIEIGRKQTLFGPHRDDIVLAINAQPASAFASQGQQRSLVLALKLAELKHLQEAHNEPPVLILDDVLAELDLNRQALLMSLVKAEMQTIISTTHLSGFQPAWLAGALILPVAQGAVLAPRESATTEPA